LETTRPLFTSYLRIRKFASSPSSPELAQARSELETNLQEINNDLQDLVESVRVVEQDPFKYGLDIDEVERRRLLVKDVGDEIARMREELVSTVRAKTGGVGAAGDLPDPSSFAAPGDEGGDDYEALEQQRQVQIMQEQDEALDDVFRTVGNLRDQAGTMGRELEEQGQMIEEVNGIADRVGGKLQGGMKRLNTVIQKNEGTVALSNGGAALISLQQIDIRAAA
jgi:t-SNARE syntaxin family protein